MAVDLGKKEKELREAFEKLGVSDLEEQIEIMGEMKENPQMALPQNETEVQDAGLEI